MERLPVQLGRWSDEAANEDLLRFYGRLLSTINDDVFHQGEWRLLDLHPAGDGSSSDLLAWRWLLAGEMRVVVVNLGEGTAQGLVQLSFEVAGDPEDEAIVFEDQLDGERYTWPRHALNESGLYVKLGRGAAHIFSIVN